ncbi:hypothetical protein SORBI_3003G198701 [Sorghum bicolor]|uniref:X8 domain-containing protein n=1 Tax=Sorghum bicolor TaxID=4558 RepID=A0A1B6Q4D9_SORBI|nr:hypothetical protein SORBI_3003G198701 [Sorghum bicolor]
MEARAASSAHAGREKKKKSAHTPTRTHDATSRLLAAVTITSRAAWEREEAEAAPAHACKLASRSAVRSGAPRRPGPLGRGDPAAGWLADAVLAAAAHRVGTLTVAAHCSWAANTYYQNNKARGATCDFGGAATISTTDPSFSGCTFASSATRYIHFLLCCCASSLFDWRIFD